MSVTSGSGVLRHRRLIVITALSAIGGPDYLLPPLRVAPPEELPLELPLELPPELLLPLYDDELRLGAV
jgi:hypothetical protein